LKKKTKKKKKNFAQPMILKSSVWYAGLIIRINY